MSDAEFKSKKKRKSGIPTGNAGEYLVMGELLRRGFDAQLADRNTKGYDVLAALHDQAHFKRIQVKTVRTQPWFVRRPSFEGVMREELTIYVLLGLESGVDPVRFFIVKNGEVAEHVHYPPDWHEQPKWRDQGFLPLKAIEKYENNWNAVCPSN